jgi:formate dehydrogenase major subunit
LIHALSRSAAVADFYAPIRAGTDIAFLGGVINYLLSHDKLHHDYVKNYTDATFLVKNEFGFEDGIYSGYDAAKRKYDRSSWGCQIGPDGYVVTDPTMENPRCVHLS